MKANPALADRLESMKETLGLQVIEAMYASNPFWEERFGKRGRRHADQDAGYHLSYLGSALRIGSASVMTEYARWLQGVLVSRGMCSRHLAENFARMREAIGAAGIPDADEAVELLRSAEDALVHREGLAQRVETAAPGIAAAVATALLAVQSEWQATWGDRARARCEDDVRYHLAYLADAVHSARPELFADHEVFVASTFARRGWQPRRLEELLEALERELGRVLGTLTSPEQGPVASSFALARERLVREQAPSSAGPGAGAAPRTRAT